VYVPPAFREDDRATLHAAINDARLSHLVTATTEGLIATPLPLFLVPDEGPHGTLYGHVSRANEHWKLAPIGEAMALFMGPHAYVSPSWYPSKQEHHKVVPTWNYLAVHAYGPVEFFEDAERLLDVVTRLTNLHEKGRATPWAVSDAPETFITAHDALFTRARVHMGDRVLIHAAASGVGTAAIQLSHAAGAIVYGTSRTADKLERIHNMNLGLDASLAVGDTPANFVEAVRKWTTGAGVDVILDLVAGNYFPANLNALASRGRLICIGTMAGAKSEIDIGLLLGKRATITGTMLRGRSVEEKAEATRLFAAAVLPLVSSGMIRPVIDRVYSVDAVCDAHERMESNASFGKIVLTFP